MTVRSHARPSCGFLLDAVRRGAVNGAGDEVGSFARRLRAATRNAVLVKIHGDRLYSAMRARLDAELLISLVENRPIIWDKTLEMYKDKKLRSTAWREICNMLKNDFEEMDEKGRYEFTKLVVKKWNQLRDSWIRTLNSKNGTKKSGSASMNVRKYIYHNQLLFLKKVIHPTLTRERIKNKKQTCDEAEEGDTVTEEDEREISCNQNEDTASDNRNQDNSHVTTKKKKRCDVLRQQRMSALDKKIGNQLKSSANAQQKDLNINFINRLFPSLSFPNDEQKMMSFIDHQLNKTVNADQEDRNLNFFKSLLPSLVLLDDDQILEFQSGVINLLQNIKCGRNFNKRSSQQSLYNHSYSCQSQPHYSTEQPPTSTSTQHQFSEHSLKSSPNASTASDLPDISMI